MPKNAANKIRSDNTYRNIAILCGISIVVELLIFVLTPTVFHSFVDQWGLKVYFETLIVPLITHGNLPYIDYFWEYPILMVIPVFIAAIPFVITKDIFAFYITFLLLMVACNLVTTSLVYIVTKKIYQNTKRAFIAGLLYATAISTAYFTLVAYEPMPVMLMMLGITCTVYGTDKLKSYGYIFYILGFFTKIYTIAILPFLIFFNAKKTSLREEIIPVVKTGGILFLILFVPIYLINPSMIDTYIIKNAASKPIFVSSFVYAIYVWLNGMLGLPISETTVSNIMTVILIIVLISLFYLAYSTPSQNAVLMLQLTLIALVSIIACSKYHSPQYMIWFIPILCILIAGDLSKMVTFYLLQILWFVKFPLSFNIIWENQAYHTPLALFFFTVEYAILFYLVWTTTVSKWNSYARLKYRIGI